MALCSCVHPFHAEMSIYAPVPFVFTISRVYANIKHNVDHGFTMKLCFTAWRGPHRACIFICDETYNFYALCIPYPMPHCLAWTASCSAAWQRCKQKWQPLTRCTPSAVSTPCCSALWRWTAPTSTLTLQRTGDTGHGFGDRDGDGAKVSLERIFDITKGHIYHSCNICGGGDAGCLSGQGGWNAGTWRDHDH
eukprot:1149900-Pelagomonas_calceolata.AAC.5